MVAYLPYPVVGAAGYLEIDKEFSLRPLGDRGLPPERPHAVHGGEAAIEVSVRPSVNVEIPLVWRAGAPSTDVVGDLPILVGLGPLSGLFHGRRRGVPCGEAAALSCMAGTPPPPPWQDT